MVRVFAIIPAAGASSRMKSPQSKVLLSLRNETVVARTLRLLSEKTQFDFVVVAAARADIAEVQAAVAGCATPLVVIEGGATRQQSVSHALTTLTERCAPDNGDIVVVHDAARCFVSPDLVQRCISAAMDFGAVTAAVPVVDTLIRTDSAGVSQEWLDRTHVWAVQTPQVFQYGLLRQGHVDAPADVSDDTALVARFHKVRVVEGSRENIKLTTPADFEFASRYLA